MKAFITDETTGVKVELVGAAAAVSPSQPHPALTEVSK